MEARVLFDDAKFESKEKGVDEGFKQPRTAKFSKICKLWGAVFTLLVVVVSAASLLFSARVDWFLKSSRAGAFVRSLNHHVVFLIGNAIIFLLFAIFRHGEAAVAHVDFYDEYAKHAPTVNRVPAGSIGAGEGEEEKIQTPSPCDDVAEVVKEAERLIRRFERAQSEKLKREIENRRESGSSDAAEMERLSSEEFRRRVDAFIDEHWCRKSEVYRVRSELSVN